MPSYPLPLDGRIAELRSTLDRTRSNLVELDADVIRKTLESSSSLEGATAEAWSRARRQFADLWQGQLALDAVLESITAERGARPSIPKAALNRITALLDGTSVVLAPTGPDSGRRSLTDGTNPTVSCSIDDAIARMSLDYDAVVGVVGQVDAVWTRTLQELEDLGAAVERLDAGAAADGSHRPNDLGRARRQIAELERQARQDPLSFPPTALASIKSTVDRARASIEETATAAREVDADLGALQSNIDACRISLGRVRADYARPDQKVAIPDGARMSLDGAESELAGLQAELEAARLTTSSHPVEVRRRAGVLASAAADVARRIADLGSIEATGVADRDELRGRIAALRAKAQATGRGEDPELDRIYDEARNALYSAPCDLQRARELVTSFQHTLRGPQDGAG